MIVQALEANPSLQAAQASLWQAKENLYAAKGKLLPSVDANSSATREQFSPAEFGGAGAPFIFNLFQATVNVSFAPDVWGGQRRAIEANAAAAEYQRFELEATYLTLTSNVVTAAVQEASLRGQIAATRDIIKAETDQLNVVQQQFNLGARDPHRRADAAIRGGDHAGDAAAAAEAARAAAPRAAGADRPLSQRGAARALDARRRCNCRPACRSACRRSSSSSGPTCARRRRNCTRPAPRSASPSPPGCRSSTSPATTAPPPRRRRPCSRRHRASGASPRAAPSRSSTASRCCIRNAPPKPPTTWPTRNTATPCWPRSRTSPTRCARCNSMPTTLQGASRAPCAPRRRRSISRAGSTGSARSPT